MTTLFKESGIYWGVFVMGLCPLLAGFFGDAEGERVARTGEEDQNDGLHEEEESGAEDALKGSSYTDDYAEEDVFDGEDYRTHCLSTHGSVGQGWSLGIGYSFASGSESRHGASWGAIGPNVNLSRRGDSGYGVFSLITARLGGVSHGGGLACELSAGWGASEHIRAGVLEAGLYYTVEYAEIGYSIRAAVGVARRPPWLGKHFLSIRLYSPLRSTRSSSPFD